MARTNDLLVVLLLVGALVYVAGCSGGGDPCAEEKDQNAKNQCYFEKAVADKSAELCDKITSNDLKQQCSEEAKAE